MTHSDSTFHALMEDVLHELANQPAPAGLTQRLQQRIPAMPSQVLHFHTLDRAAGPQSSRKTIVGATLLHLAALLLITLGLHSAHVLSLPSLQVVTLTDPPLPPPMPPKSALIGGGGGQKGPAPVNKGNPPKFAAEQLNPPKAPPTIAPKIDIPVTVDVQKDLRMATADVPNLGMPNAPLVGTSLGNGYGTGIGSGNGGGIGPGTNGNYGGGIRKVGGGVSAPIVLFQPEPEFSEEARKAKVAGNVLLALIVDTNGKPTRIRVLRGIGMGLDEKARQAAALYKFKPALENGKPVAVEINLEVNFQIF